MVFGLAAVFSCTVDYQAADEIVPSTVPRSVFNGQFVWAVLGAMVMFVTLLIPYRHFENFAWLAYLRAQRVRQRSERRDDRVDGTPAHDFRRKKAPVVHLDDYR